MQPHAIWPCSLPIFCFLTPGEVVKHQGRPSEQPHPVPPPPISSGGLTRMGAGCPQPRRRRDVPGFCSLSHRSELGWHPGLRGDQAPPLWLLRSSLERHRLLSARFAGSFLPDPRGPRPPSPLEWQLIFKSLVWDVARNPFIRAVGIVSPLSSPPSAGSGSGPPHSDAFWRRTWPACLQPDWVGSPLQRGVRGAGVGLPLELPC